MIKVNETYLRDLHDDLLMYKNMIEKAVDELTPLPGYIQEDLNTIDRLIKGEESDD